MNFKKLLLLFITVPAVELALFVMLADVISLPLTFIIILITGALGAYLTKQQGALAITNFQSALRAGKLPHAEATEGILVLVAGVVLLTPGFLTDAVGFSLLVPQVRAVVRDRLALLLKDRIQVPAGMPVNRESPDSLKPARGRVVSDES